MNTPNLKLYIGISAGLLLVFIILVVFPFGKKSINNQSPIINNFPTPTTVEISNQSAIEPTIPSSDFTGVAEEELPQSVVDLSTQKQQLRSQIPFDTGLFSIDFDYGEDKFVVTLNEPKDQARTEFNDWLKNNYPVLNINQFNFK